MRARIACLLVPLFPLAARLRAEPELDGEAVAVLEGNGAAARVVAASRRARRAGVRTGLSLAQARAILPGVIARGRDATCERAAQDALLEAAETLSPRVEDATPGIAYLDAGGLERRFPEGEGAIVRAGVRAARRLGLPARGGLAASKLVARLAASLEEDTLVVAAGTEPAFLAPLPVARLVPSPRALASLGDWGVRTIGDLARLEPGALASRLGREGAELGRAARGEDLDPLVPRKPAVAYREGLELEWPLVALEPFQFVARAALGRLVERLELRGLACLSLVLDLELDPRGHDRRRLRLPAPTREVKTLLELTRLDLEARPPGAAVVAFAFTAEPAAPRPVQTTLFGPPSPSPDRLATTLARLAVRLGEDRVGSPAVVDRHDPAAFVLTPFVLTPFELMPDPLAPPLPEPVVRERATGDEAYAAGAAEHGDTAGGAFRSGRGLLGMRAIRPPLGLDVRTAGGRAGGRPQALFPVAVPRDGDARPRTDERRVPRLGGRVAVASGPWRLEEGWWRDTPLAREYWDVELEAGGLYRVYRDRASGAWFLDGIYD